MTSMQSLAHRRFPQLFGTGNPETALLDYPSNNLLRCVALDAATGLPNVISSGHSLHAIPECANFVEMLQQVDSNGQIIADHYVTVVCPSLPQPSPANPHPRPSKGKHYSCYFPSEFLNPSFIFHGVYAGGFRATMASTGLSVVIKRIDLRRLRSLRSNFSKLVAREKALLQRLSNVRIPRMTQQYVDPLDDEFVYFVLEDGGSSTLVNLMRSSMINSVALKPSIVKKIMTDVFSALSYLHHNNIVHRDLKADNVTVTSHDVSSLSVDNTVAQVIDFGMGRVLIQEDSDPEEIQQHELDALESDVSAALDYDDSATPEAEPSPLFRRCTPSESHSLYSAPEITLTRGNYNSKIDVFATGCLLAELLFCCNSNNFVRRQGEESEYLKRRWLYPARFLDQSRLTPFQQILPILKHAVMDEGDILHPHLGRATLTPSACERLADDRSPGFNRQAMMQCCTEMFEFQDLSDRFSDPHNLVGEELSTFRLLREVLKGCVAFDPSRRLTAHAALESLTGRIHHYGSMPAQLLEDLKSVELAVQHLDPGSQERRKRFIKHIGAPTPISELLDPALP